ncbi:MAG TPA: hypothetical protein VKW08_16795 [Xanthobacteraceae bacterium]|jgi:hypothetical protein|nr:hypothetical protein [Xanthobacteraceae bacterium]
MSSADRYRRNACECVAITSFFADPQQRATILALAEAWTRLAEQAERNEQMSAREQDPDTHIPGSAERLCSADRGEPDDDAAEDQSALRQPARPGKPQNS